jgi:hypothetical protein
MATETAWRMRGDVMEACSCATTCPCNFGSDPIPLPCEVVLGWRITDGHYGNTRLDGLNVVLYGRMPATPFKAIGQSASTLTRTPTNSRRRPLGTSSPGRPVAGPAVLGPLIGNLLVPQQVPIRFETVDGEHRITVPGLLEVGSERVPNPLSSGQPPLDPKVSDLAVPFYTGAAHVRRSWTLKLTDPNMAFEYSNRSSLISNFDYSGP